MCCCLRRLCTAMTINTKTFFVSVNHVLPRLFELLVPGDAAADGQARCGGPGLLRFTPALQLEGQVAALPSSPNNTTEFMAAALLDVPAAGSRLQASSRSENIWCVPLELHILEPSLSFLANLKHAHAITMLFNQHLLRQTSWVKEKPVIEIGNKCSAAMKNKTPTS